MERRVATWVHVREKKATLMWHCFPAKSRMSLLKKLQPPTPITHVIIGNKHDGPMYFMCVLKIKVAYKLTK